MIKRSVAALFVCLFFFSSSSVALASIVVTPNQAGLGVEQTFTLGVTNEKDTPITSVRLRIPEQLENVTPNVKPEWNVEVTETEDPDGTIIRVIEWTEGQIPVEKREDFRFSTVLPKTETVLIWKVYQVYDDGTIVSWDQAPTNITPTGIHGESNLGPYAETQVMQQLPPLEETDTIKQPHDPSFGGQVLAFFGGYFANAKIYNQLSIAAFFLAVIAVTIQLKRRK